LYIKPALFVVLTLFILSGCGGNDNGAIGTQDEPSNETRETMPPDDSTPEGNQKDKVAPLEGEDSPMTEGEKEDMPELDNQDQNTSENEVQD